MDLDALRHEDPILKVLHAAQERIRLPERWRQCVFGDWMFDDTQICAWGALNWVEYRAAGNLGCGDSTVWAQAFDYLDTAARQIGYLGIADLNDSTDHPTVMAMFDRAQELRMADMMEAVAAEATP